MNIDLSPSMKIVAWAVGALAALLFAAWVVWKLFFAQHAADAAHDKAEIHAQQVVGKATSDAGAKASNIVAESATKEAKTHEITRDHYFEITKAPGADDIVPPAVDAAFRRAICLRDSAARLPECQRLQKAGAE